MKVSATVSNQADFKILEAGTHAAVCSMIVGIGPQQGEYQGKITEKEKIKMRFEVPAERITWTTKDGETGEGPMVIWATYTASLHENSKLRRDLTSWRGVAFTEEELAGFELKNVLGAPCMISVSHREHAGKTYANIDSISRLMKGLPVPKAEGTLIMFDFDEHTQADLDALPSWLQDKVKAGQALRTEQEVRTEAPPADKDYYAALDDPESMPF